LYVFIAPLLGGQDCTTTATDWTAIAILIQLRYIFNDGLLFTLDLDEVVVDLEGQGSFSLRLPLAIVAILASVLPGWLVAHWAAHGVRAHGLRATHHSCTGRGGRPWPSILAHDGDRGIPDWDNSVSI
jgi:hypothetical protein